MKTGTSKLGTDDGRLGGSAVVDLNTQVYGTDNLFVVDASIFPGHVTANPTAYIVIASEHAAERILALTPATAQSQFTQCGGLNYSGSFQCAAPYTCTYQNEYYSQVSALYTGILELLSLISVLSAYKRCLRKMLDCIYVRLVYRHDHAYCRGSFISVHLLWITKYLKLANNNSMTVFYSDVFIL